jgi:hypothetical protein
VKVPNADPTQSSRRRSTGPAETRRRHPRCPAASAAADGGRRRARLHVPLEAGDTNVSIGIYAGVLQALGLLDGLIKVADISNDSVGQALASAELPKHIHLKRKTGASSNG